MIVLEVWGLARAQDSTTGRALVAVLAFPLLICCCIGFAVVVAGMAGAGAAANMR
jgi:hypothetical protein